MYWMQCCDVMTWFLLITVMIFSSSAAARQTAASEEGSCRIKYCIKHDTKQINRFDFLMKNLRVFYK